MRQVTLSPAKTSTRFGAPVVRQAVADDAAAIGQLVRSLIEDSLVDPQSEDAARFYATLSPAEVARFMTLPNLYYAVAQEGNSIVGVILVRDNNYVAQLFVSKEHQGQGVGSSLWQFALDNALQCGATGEFSVLSSIVAKPLYEKFGFVALGSPEVKHGFRFIRMQRAPDPR